MKLIHTFSALNHRNFRLFWGAQLFSLSGIWMQSVAQGWLVVTLTDSAFLLGLISMIAFLPIFLFSLLGGIAADHLNRRNILLLTQTLSMGLAFILGGLISSELIRFWHIAVTVGFFGLVSAFDIPARQAFTIDMVGRKDIGNAIALNSTAFNIARIAGPVAAGFLVGNVGISSCFYINGITFLFLIAALLFMKGNFVPKNHLNGEVRARLLEGAKFVFSNRKIAYLMILVAIMGIFGLSNTILLPIFAKNILNIGAGGLGMLVSAIGLGALSGSLTLAHFSRYNRRFIFIPLGGIVMGLGLIMFSFSGIYPLSLIILIIVGWGFSLQIASINTFLNECSPDNLRGRVMSFYTFMFLGMMPFGTFQAGLLAQFFSAPAAMAFGGAMCILGASIYSKITAEAQRRGENL